MPALDSNRVLSTPKVLVDGRIIKIIPNSCTYEVGGETNIRAVSAGGGTVSVVAGVNAEEMLSMVSFEVAHTAEMGDFVREQRAKANRGESVTIRIVEATQQFAFAPMFLQNKPSLEFKADGSIKMEYKGGDQTLQ